MDLFFSNKKTNVGYIVDTTTSFTDLDVPSDIFFPVEKQNQVNFGCPATTSLENRLYYIPAFADITVSFGIKGNKPYYNYIFNDSQLNTTEAMHNLLKEMLSVDITSKNNVFNFQFKLPYLFVTDDKTLELSVLVPNIETKNCTFMSGGFNIYGWLRHINAAWVLNNKKQTGQVVFKQGEPMLYIYFNKATKLKEIEFTNNIYKYLKRHSKSVNYIKNVSRLFNRIINKRPKKLL